MNQYKQTLTYKLPRKRGRTEISVTDRSQGHEAPPEGIQEGPGALGVVLLREVDQGGERQHSHAHQKHQQTKLFVRLFY